MKGSCLCEKCVFELKGRISAVGECHCSKCRKVSGTGSIAVHWARPDNLQLIKGTENIKEYSIPHGWKTVFCSNCGSPLPAMDGKKTMWFVPAGLIDENPGVGVRGHIWVESKPSWEVIGDDTPQYKENAP